MISIVPEVNVRGYRGNAVLKVIEDLAKVANDFCDELCRSVHLCVLLGQVNKVLIVIVSWDDSCWHVVFWPDAVFAAVKFICVCGVHMQKFNIMEFYLSCFLCRSEQLDQQLSITAERVNPESTRACVTPKSARDQREAQLRDALLGRKVTPVISAIPS
jgi:hypothetical protein